jgi:hypothetical protein
MSSEAREARTPRGGPRRRGPAAPDPAADAVLAKLGDEFRQLYRLYGHPAGLNSAHRFRVEHGRAKLQTIIKVAAAYGFGVELRLSRPAPRITATPPEGVTLDETIR